MTQPVASRIRAWLPLLPWALVVTVGFVEVVAHLVQVNRTVTDAQWIAARDAVKGIAQPRDLIVFAPKWTDPLGRRFFGDALAPIAREARADETAFPRAIEVSIRGQHLPAFANWRKLDERSVGPFTIATLENPAPVAVLDDLLGHANAEGMHVSEVALGHELDCPWGDYGLQTGGLGFGPTVPSRRFNCSRAQSFVGVSVLTSIDYTPRQCFFVIPPSNLQNILRIRFANVAFGKILHGHHGLDVHVERDRRGPPVNLEWRVGDRVLGKLVHRDGEGWKGFDIGTEDLNGTSGDLVADISTSGPSRKYCFEADTR